MDKNPSQKKYSVGGVLLDRPFKIRRLGHFGLNVKSTKNSIEFYCNLLGFRISDPMDISKMVPNGDELKKIGDPCMYFTRHGTDHHSLVFMQRNVFEALGRNALLGKDVTVNQLTWQVNSLCQITDAIDYFENLNIPVSRSGRDMPGSNWHVYPYDPEGHRNELYYGIEQIGWLGRSKPSKAYDRGFHQRPELPQIPEYLEVEKLTKAGEDLTSGFQHPENNYPIYDVEGILLPRPFKIVRVGPIGLFCKNLDLIADFYIRILGFKITQEIVWNGYTCKFLTCNTEHHSLALYPIELRSKLEYPFETTTMSFGIEISSYEQLRNAVHYLHKQGCKFFEIPAELTPGIAYTANLIDPCGHIIHLYFGMQQIPSNRESNYLVPNTQWKNWPLKVPNFEGSYEGETFLGPLG